MQANVKMAAVARMQAAREAYFAAKAAYDVAFEARTAMVREAWGDPPDRSAVEERKVWIAGYAKATAAADEAVNRWPLFEALQDAENEVMAAAEDGLKVAGVRIPAQVRALLDDEETRKSVRLNPKMRERYIDICLRYAP